MKDILEYFEIGKRHEIPRDRFVSIGYKDDIKDEIFYLTDENTFSNNIDDALYITREESEQVLDRIKDTRLMEQISSIAAGIFHSIYNLLWIVGDSYRVIGFRRGNNTMKIFGVHQTPNLSETLKYNIESSCIDIYYNIRIEKYFSETDEWYNIETGMTRDEEVISKDLVNVVNRFTKLPSHHPQHQPDMCNAIHEIQRLLQSRICHRLYPEQWPIKK